MNVASLIYSESKNFSNSHALKIEDVVTTYSDLFERALRIASILIDSGAKKETVGTLIRDFILIKTAFEQANKRMRPLRCDHLFPIFFTRILDEEKYRIFP